MEGDSEPSVQSGERELHRSVELKMGPSESERRKIRDELLETGESETAARIRSRLKHERAELIGGLFQGDTATPNRLQAVETLLFDNREALDSLAREVQAVIDNRHAARMADLAEVSNTIAERSLAQANALRRATWALVAVTAALIVATVLGGLVAAN